MTTVASRATVVLEEICEFKYGKSLPQRDRIPGPCNVYGSNGAVGTHTRALTSGAAIIIGRKGSFGEVHYSDTSCWPIDTTYYIDSTSTRCDLKWLSYQLDDLGLKDLNRAAAIPGLNRSDAYRLEVSLPPIGEQRRIAQVLDAVDALRAKRRKAVVLLDSLAQSIFLEMFGDVVKNSYDWEDSLTLTQVAEISSGITKGRRAPSTATRVLPYMTVLNVQQQRLDLSTVKTIEATEAEINRYRLIRNDLLLTEGGDPDKLGRGTLWRNELPESIHQNHIFRIRLRSNSKMEPVFLNWLTASRRGRDYFLRSAKQTTGIASINAAQLRRFPLLRPPMELQQEFAHRIGVVEHHLTSLVAHLAELDALFASIQHRAFRGELWADSSAS